MDGDLHVKKKGLGKDSNVLYKLSHRSRFAASSNYDLLLKIDGTINTYRNAITKLSDCAKRRVKWPLSYRLIIHLFSHWKQIPFSVMTCRPGR